MESVKSTYTLEFLDIPKKDKYSENDLEQKMIDNLQKFLLELVKDILDDKENPK